MIQPIFVSEIVLDNGLLIILQLPALNFAQMVPTGTILHGAVLLNALSIQFHILSKSVDYAFLSALEINSEMKTAEFVVIAVQYSHITIIKTIKTIGVS